MTKAPFSSTEIFRGLCLLAGFALLPPAFASVSTETKKWRLAEVAKCASCHQDVYQQWKRGPHARAHETLEADQRFHHERFKKLAPKGSVWKPIDQTWCMQCHYPKGYLEQYEQTTDFEAHNKFYIEHHKEILSKHRKRNQDGVTGVDCLDCHVKNGQVYTSNSFVPSGSGKPSCNPQKSAYLSNGNLCIRCHMEQTASFAKFKAANPSLKATSCIDCHAVQGRSHEYYWSIYGEAALKSKLAETLVAGLKVRGQAGEKGNRKLQVELDCKAHPHLLVDMVDWVFKFDFPGANKGKDAKPVLVSISRSTAFQDKKKNAENFDEIYPIDKCDTVFSFSLKIPAEAAEKGSVRVSFKKRTNFRRSLSDYLYLSSARLAY